MTVHVMQPKSAYDRECIYRFLYEIWADEFSRSMEGMDHRNRLMKDALDETAHHLIAVDHSGRILGCVRANFLDRSLLPEGVEGHLHTEAMATLFARSELCYFSHFAVAPEARGKTVASLLITAIYRHGLNEGAHVAISYCALHFLPLYYQLEYRPYTQNFRLDVGIRVPIVHCLRDRTYLDQIKSPLVRISSREVDDQGAAARKIAEEFPGFKVPGFSRTQQVHHLWARLAHTSPQEKSIKSETLFTEFSEEERRLISQRLSEITFTQGEYVYRRGESEPGMGVLLSGSLGVEITVDGVARIINVIQPGEPFGEVQSLGAVRRTAALVALEESQAFLLPWNFLEKVSHANAGLGLKVAKRLLRVLAIRFANLTDAVAEGAGASPFPVRVQRPLLYHLPDTEEIKSRVDSYRFESLGDREGEYRRLITQATIGEELEFGALGSIGLHNGAKVLDLGSGPGVTSLLVAKRLPSSTVIGVEPEGLLRQKAEVLVASQGFAQRCRFLDGRGDRIPLADGEVDFSYARLLFQHLSNPLEILAEMKRVTRPGGIVAILDVDDRTNIVYPAPTGLEDFEARIASAQAAAGGDRHVGRKLHGYMHEVGLQEIGVEHIPITAATLGRKTYFSIVYSFKRQVLERAGELDQKTTALFLELERLIERSSTFAMTTVFLSHGVVG